MTASTSPGLPALAAARPPLLEAALLAAGYAALALFAIHVARQPGSVATVWFANALAIAVLVTTPPARWPALLVATALVNVAADLAFGDPLSVALGFVPANLLEVVVGAWLLRWRQATAEIVDSPVALLLTLALGAVVPAVCGATLGAMTLVGHGLGSYGRVWLDWFAADALGAAAALPFFVALCQSRPAAWRAQLATRTVLALVLLGSVIGLVALVAMPYPFVYLTLPLLAAAALTTPLVSFALAFMTCVVVVAAFGYGLAPTTLGADRWQHALTLLPGVLAVLPAQWLATLMARQRLLNHTLSAITSATSELASVIDRDGVYRVVNRAYEDYWLRPRASIVGRHVSELIPGEIYTNTVAPLLAKALAGDPSSYRAAFDYPTHGLRTMDVSYSPTRDPDGRVIGVLVLAHDVTAAVVAHEALARGNLELRRANESLEQFARMTSHDLREPLNTIVQFSHLIDHEHRGELSPAAQQYFGLVLHGAQRMRRMLDDLLEFVRMERPEAVTQPVALGPLMQQVCDALSARVQARSARIELQPLPTVMGTDSLLAVLFQNLVSNAIKFVPAGRVPEIRIGWAPDGDEHVRVTVADNGIGIAPADQALLFQPFKRLHAQRKYEGTGLGLAICRRIAAALGGGIEIESTPEAIGTRLVVRLRRAEAGPLQYAEAGPRLGAVSPG